MKREVMQDSSPEVRPLLKATLLGGLELRYNGECIPDAAFHRRKALTLLLWLLVTHAHRLRHDQVLAAFWPEGDSRLSTVNFRGVLRSLRATLRAVERDLPVILRLGKDIALNPLLEIQVDALRFEAAATKALAVGTPTAMHEALNLYTGALLPTVAYEDWVEARRQDLTQVREQLLVALQRSSAHPDSAFEEHLRERLSDDPTDEDRARDLMRVLAGAGRRSEALRVYQRLVSALEEDLQVRPSRETRALRKQLLSSTAMSDGQPRTPGDAPAASTKAKTVGAPVEVAEKRLTNVPASRDSFIGRAREISEIRSLLQEGMWRDARPRGTRSLTLVGTGGCGKTRLAQEAVVNLRKDYADGVWLVALATIAPQSPQPSENQREHKQETLLSIVQGVAKTLSVSEQRSAPLLETLIEHLRDKQLLLLLDNCEHVVVVCAELVDRLLRACPRLTILATSREALRVSGEVVRQIAPLSVPPPGAAVQQDSEALALFVERARAVSATIETTEAQLRLMAEICRRLDGIPLALELAAAQLAHRSLTELATGLEDRFRLLAVEDHTRLPWHRTLRAALAWSYALLTESEQALLCTLSVFVGGWSLEAAEAVGARIVKASPTEDEAVLDSLSGLVQKSLVQMEEAAGRGRFHMLETVREYVAQELAARSEVAIARYRHLDWCWSIAENGNQRLVGPDQATWLELYEREHDNLRAALAWSLEEAHAVVEGTALTEKVEAEHKWSCRAEIGLRISAELWRFWWTRGHLSEGRRLLEACLSRNPEAPPSLRADALSGAGNIASTQGDMEAALKLHQESLSLRRTQGDSAGIAASLCNIGIAYEVMGDDRAAKSYLEQCLEMDRGSGDAWSIATTLTNLGNVLRRGGEFEQAKRAHAESLSVMQELGNTWGIAVSLSNLGLVAYTQGAYGQAQAHYEEGLSIAGELGDTGVYAKLLGNLGNVAYRQGDSRTAHELQLEALRLAWEWRDKETVAGCLEDLAVAMGTRHEPVSGRAARLLGAAARLREQIGTPMPVNEQALFEEDVAKVRDQLSVHAFEACWEEGRTTSLEETIEQTLGESLGS